MTQITLLPKRKNGKKYNLLGKESGHPTQGI